MFPEVVENPRSKGAWMIMLYLWGSCGAVVNSMLLSTCGSGVRVVPIMRILAGRGGKGRDGIVRLGSRKEEYGRSSLFVVVCCC